MGGLGLALGGGGIAGCSHVGVICALEEQGVPIDYISGTSAGGMVAVLYASGHSGRQLSKMVPELTKKLLDYDYGGFFWRILFHQKPFPGMIRGKRLRQYLHRAIGDKTLRELRFPLAVIACDLQSTKQVLFTNAPLQPKYLDSGIEPVRDVKAVDAVLASMSIPGLFRPIRLGNRVLVDGGLMDNCPTASLKAMGARRLLAVNLVSIRPSYPEHWSFSSIIFRSLSMGLQRMSQSDSGYADLILNPDVGSIGLLDFSSISLCMERGYDCARKHMDEILRLVDTQVAAQVPPPPNLFPVPADYAPSETESFAP